ncbi:MAG: ATP-binding protein, partial [Candidatus Hydrogenedentota bacterium]
LDIILMTESYQLNTRLQDLEEANDRLRRVLQQAPVAVFVYDAGGTIRDWNIASEKLYGYARHEAVGAHIHELLALPADRDFVKERIRRVFEGVSIGPMEQVHLDKKGRHLRLILAHAAIRGPRGIEEGVAFALDQTEIAQLREKMVEREKIAAMGTLAAGLAHEVGNPLASISAICQLIEKKGDDGRLKERIRTVRDAIDRIDVIVRRVLEFARSKGSSDHECLDLKAAVADVLNLASMDRRVKKMEVMERLPEKLPAVRVQRTAMSQVLLNLILNSAEACREGDRIEILADENDGGVSLIIQDSGPGFAGESLHRAVEPFYTTKDYGSGLGLSISYSIVERAGGTLTIANGPEGGARVEVWLPTA